MNNEPVAYIDPYELERLPHYDCYIGSQQLKNGIPLYTHPAKTLRHENHDLDRGTWTVGQTESQEFIESSDFNHDVRLYLNGDFETDAQRLNYLQHIADRLNTHPAKTLTDEEILNIAHQIRLIDRQTADDGHLYFARAILRKAQEK